jgi:hypothetical protein
MARRIKRLCDICLLSGFTKNLSQIGKAVVLEEVKGFKGLGYKLV